MSRIRLLAQAYSVPETDVARWPQRVKDVLYRNAIHRGWLLPNEENQ